MEHVIEYYSRFDEWGRLDREPLEFIINWHYMRHYLPSSGRVLDNGAGPGKYAMALAEPNNTMDAIDRFRRTGIFNHADPGRFTGAYYFNIDEIKPFMESHGFETIDLIGSSSIGGLLSQEQMQAWEDKGESEQLLNTLIDMARDPSIAGISSHLLYIGKRK